MYAGRRTGGTFCLEEGLSYFDLAMNLDPFEKMCSVFLTAVLFPYISTATKCSHVGLYIQICDSESVKIYIFLMKHPDGFILPVHNLAQLYLV